MGTNVPFSLSLLFSEILWRGKRRWVATNNNNNTEPPLTGGTLRHTENYLHLSNGGLYRHGGVSQDRSYGDCNKRLWEIPQWQSVGRYNELMKYYKENISFSVLGRSNDQRSLGQEIWNHLARCSGGGLWIRHLVWDLTTILHVFRWKFGCLCLEMFQLLIYVT